MSPTEGAQEAFLRNQTASTKHEVTEGQVCLRKWAEEWAAGCSVSGGAGEKMTVVGWD